jgi:NADPH:quinone reductase-like Zn-dependent oxidoreductase
MNSPDSCMEALPHQVRHETAHHTLFPASRARAIRPRVAERISFDEVAEAHRRLETGGLDGKLVLCPDLPSRRDRAASR